MLCYGSWDLLLPSVIIIVPLGAQTINGIYPHINHPSQLSLLLLHICDGIRHWRIHIQLLPNINPPTKRNESENTSDNALPLTSGRSHFGVSLTEAGSVQGFLFFDGKLFPVALLLIFQCLNFRSSLPPSDCWHWKSYMIDIAVLPINTPTDNLPVSNPLPFRLQGNVGYLLK